MVVSLDHAAGEIDTEDDVTPAEDEGKVRAFHLVGTTDREPVEEEEKREHMLEEYLVSDRPVSDIFKPHFDPINKLFTNVARRSHQVRFSSIKKLSKPAQ